MPYSAILSKDLYQDILKYYLMSNWQPSRKADLTNVPIDSKLINVEQAALISSWIQGNNKNKITNKFKRVYYEFFNCSLVVVVMDLQMLSFMIGVITKVLQLRL